MVFYHLQGIQVTFIEDKLLVSTARKNITPKLSAQAENSRTNAANKASKLAINKASTEVIRGLVGSKIAYKAPSMKNKNPSKGPQIHTIKLVTRKYSYARNRTVLHPT